MDKYELTQSEMIRIAGNNQTIQLNLQLKKNIFLNHCLIYGYVRDKHKCPLKAVHILFLDKKNNVIGSTYTSNEGYYAFIGVKFKKKIRMVMAKDGYKPKITSYKCIHSKKVKYNSYLKKSCNATKTILCGHIMDENNKMLEHIPMYIFKKRKYSNKYKYKKYITSNTYGQFCFTNLSRGAYCLLINFPMYNISYNKFQILNSSVIYTRDIFLIKCDKWPLYTSL